MLLQVTVAYKKDPSSSKVNLGVGAYRTEVRVRSLCKVEGIISDADVFSAVKLDVQMLQKLLCNL